MSKLIVGILNRNVTTKECHWLDEDFKQGTKVYQYFGPTYGCVNEENGVAVTLEKDKLPFNEIPWDAIDWLK